MQRTAIAVLIAIFALLVMGLVMGNGKKESPQAPASQGEPAKPAKPAKRPARSVYQKPIMAETKAPELQKALDEIAATLPGCTGFREVKVEVADR